MNALTARTRKYRAIITYLFLISCSSASAADKELLDVLLNNGAISQSQYDELIRKPNLSSEDFDAKNTSEESVKNTADQTQSKTSETKGESTAQDPSATESNGQFPVNFRYGKKGFRLETHDGNWQTNLKWRAQLRYTSPTHTDPRDIEDFESDKQSSFDARRLRMNIGGHGFKPWLKYYFQVDLQPASSVSNSSSSTNVRLIDWRITLDKYEALTLRLGQWKLEYNRERYDSSGRQQFVERSIVNRIFNIDRQVGAQLSGRLFSGTPADMRYYAGIFNGEGRATRNDDESLMYMGRVQWNFLGRDLKWRQTDVEHTEKPTGSLSFSTASHDGRCTRWSSSGCGKLDGFLSPSDAIKGQYEVEQYAQGFAFKWRGFSVQEEFHWKTIDDTVNNTSSDLKGAYLQSGYFFHNLLPAIPKELELAARYAFVEEPNATDISIENKREEVTVAANWFIAGHNNKITADYSYLTLEDGVANRELSENRFRVQWDISF